MRFLSESHPQQTRRSDVHQLKLVDALRRSGLSIEGIRYIVRLAKRGEDSVNDRREIIQTQTTALEYQIAEAEESLALLRAELESLKSQIDEEPF